MDKDIQEKILSRTAAAAWLGVSKQTLDLMNIPRVKLRRRVLYRQSVLLQWLEKNTGSKKVQA